MGSFSFPAEFPLSFTEDSEWCNIDLVRSLTDLEEDEISDEDLEVSMNYAMKMVKSDLNVSVTRESVSYRNGMYKLDYTPIADTNYDCEVDSNDINLYRYKVDDDPRTREDIEVEEVYPIEGIIIAPRYSNVYADYDYYLGNRLPGWDLLSEAVAYLTGYVAVGKIRGKVPTYMRMSGMTVDDENPGSRFEKAYKDTIRKLKVKMGTIKSLDIEGRETSGDILFPQ